MSEELKKIVGGWYGELGRVFRGDCDIHTYEEIIGMLVEELPRDTNGNIIWKS